ncbi:MAG: acetyl-CoA carboxylase biotin carboxyl carrier protein [Gemmatimonadota bacterium]|nr:MAG: acetyl-CoA carboxylase biotin carboxyl carrier protein [Gemmatimonadota bacterium]
MIDISLVEKLVHLLSNSDAQTIEIKKKWWTTTIRVSKNSTSIPTGPVSYHVSANPVASPAVSQPPDSAALAAAPATGGESGAAEPAPEAPPAANLVEIKSPMVGTFYAQPEPGADPYVQIGGRIAIGQTLCIIEAMKIMNPLDSEISGVVREITVQDAQPVEFGQVLFRVDPNG